MRACIRLYADPAQIQECKAKLTMANGAFTMLSGVLALAANEVRLKILYLLEEEKEL